MTMGNDDDVTSSSALSPRDDKVDFLDLSLSPFGQKPRQLCQPILEVSDGDCRDLYLCEAEMRLLSSFRWSLRLLEPLR